MTSLVASDVGPGHAQQLVERLEQELVWDLAALSRHVDGRSGDVSDAPEPPD
jgi:hypothetical protein